MMGYLNLASLVLGGVALILPIVCFIMKGSLSHKNWGALSVLSAISCAMALFFQILASYKLVQRRDLAALDDVYGTIVFAASLLLFATVILNSLLLFAYPRK